MYPHHMSHMGPMVFRRGPSRIVWFILGGIATSWFIKRRPTTIQHPDGTMETRWGGGSCFKRPSPQTLPPAYPAQDVSPFASLPQAAQASTPAPASVPVQPQWPAQNPMFQEQQKQWQDDTEQFWRQTGDSMSQMSEATLDSVLSTVEALKAKLAEHRVQREQQQKLIDEQKRVIEVQRQQQQQQSRHLV